MRKSGTRRWSVNGLYIGAMQPPMQQMSGGSTRNRQNGARHFVLSRRSDVWDAFARRKLLIHRVFLVILTSAGD